MSRPMKKPFALAPLALLAGCVIYHNAPIVDGGPPAPEGTAVALGQPVHVGGLVATPKEVTEDSRCPENVRCVWAGRLVVLTRLDGPGWRETPELVLGETYATRGTSITLVSGTPARRAGTETAPGDYRFVYEGGR